MSSLDDWKLEFYVTSGANSWHIDKHFGENVLLSMEKLIKYEKANSVHTVGTVVNHPELPFIISK